jgi:hypothetical protein
LRASAYLQGRINKICVSMHLVDNFWFARQAGAYSATEGHGVYRRVYA